VVGGITGIAGHRNLFHETVMSLVRRFSTRLAAGTVHAEDMIVKEARPISDPSGIILIGHLHRTNRLTRMRLLTPCLPVRVDSPRSIRRFQRG
jgi:hypothetical protein